MLKVGLRAVKEPVEKTLVSPLEASRHWMKASDDL